MSNPFEYNGGSVLAMVGKDCFAIASDKRFGVQLQTMSMNFPKTFKIHDHLYCGLVGLQTDISTLLQQMKFRVNLYKLREGREVKAKTFASMLSNAQYEKRFGYYFIQPVVAGFHEGQPYVCGMDNIGCLSSNGQFAMAGTASEQMVGMCESMWKPDMEPDDLFEVISQTLLSAVDRDILSGWGAVVHVVTKDRVISKELRGRMD